MTRATLEASTFDRTRVRQETREDLPDIWPDLLQAAKDWYYQQPGYDLLLLKLDGEPPIDPFSDPDMPDVGRHFRTLPEI